MLDQPRTLPRSLQLEMPSGCPLCDAPGSFANDENCSECNAPGRARALSVLVDHVLTSVPGVPPLPLLAFAMTGAERTQLDRVFTNYTSASLYGHYGAGHEEGVDIRDLGRYPAKSKSGVFGSLLFDYFVEHEQALQQAFEVTADGGVFFTHIAPYRLTDDSAAPGVASVIKPRPDYFSYVPEGADMPSVNVGRDWFIQAIERAGFESARISVQDGRTADIEWFVGVKPTQKAPVPASPQQKLSYTQSFSRTYMTPVDPAHGFKRVALELSVPSMPTAGDQVDFAEHVLDAGRQPTDTVIACTKGGVIVSRDLGESWEYIRIAELNGTGLLNSFTTHDGIHLLQGRSAATLGIPRDDETLDGPIAVLDKDWNIQECAAPGVSMWHGSRAIDESVGVIVYGEYPENKVKYTSGFDSKSPTPAQRALLHDSRLFRSTDGGRSWESVLRLDWKSIRHFHTVAADPWQPNRWWASSGDFPDECRVWQSLDYGLTWAEVASELPSDQLPPLLANANGVLRYTDIAVREHDLIWGADDWLGAGWPGDADAPASRRGGSRLFRSGKDLPWRPESLGYVGNPIRSLVDVGPAYLVFTEAKGKCDFGFRPQVMLLSKSEPFLLTPLLTVDNFGEPPATGFTFSRASRAAKDGVFFTYRRATDAFPGGPNILRWRVTFE